MVTKSSLSSPPRVRGEPIDVQEIEVELASVKYQIRQKSIKHALSPIASGNQSSVEPNPAATGASVTSKSIRSLSPPRGSVSSEPNDREPPKDQQLPDQQQTTAVTTPASPERKGKHGKSSSKPENQKDTTSALASNDDVDAEPSVVEVQLSCSPAQSRSPSPLTPVEVTKSNPSSVTSNTTSTTKQSSASTPKSRAHSLPTGKTAAVVAGAAAAAAVATGLATTSGIKSTSSTVSSSSKVATPTLTTTTKAVTNTMVTKASTPKAETLKVAAKSETPTGNAATPKGTTKVATPKGASAATKAETQTVASASKETSTSNEINNLKDSSATKESNVVTKEKNSAFKETATSKEMSATKETTTKATGKTTSQAAVALTKAPSGTIVTSPSVASITASPSKTAGFAKVTNATKPSTLVLPSMASSTTNKPPISKSSEHRSSPSFLNFGKSKSARDDRLVVRDGKLFHIRLTLAFLTGVTAERLPEYQHLPLHNGKKNVPPHSKSPSGTNTSATAQEESVHVGFAMLSQGDGTMALSHPLKPFDFSTNLRQTLLWTETSDAISASHTAHDEDHDTAGEHDDNESQLTHNAGQRRLYFEISLNREAGSPVATDPTSDDPDDATAKEILKEVAANYSPELVPIVVGLKKGEDQLLPLGIATLVVSGREVSGQHMDLPVRLLTPTEREAYNTESPDKKKKKGPSFRFFGGGKRTEVPAPTSCFKNEDHSYSLAPNATLRVRVDVRSGMYMEHGPALWGDVFVQRPDDESRGTVTVYDLSAQGDREVVKRSLFPLDDRHEYVEVLPNPNGTTIISSPGGALRASAGFSSQHSRLQGRDDESLQTRFEVTSIFAASTDMRSAESNSESISLLERLENAGICGALDKLDDRALSSSNSFTSTLPDVDRPELDSVQSGRSAGDTFLAEATSSTSKVSKSQSRATRTSGTTAPSRGTFFKSAEDDDDDDEEGVYCEASKSSGADSSTEGGTRTSVTTRSVGDETYEKVREAKRTLLRYASRVGVEMEDLLDDSTIRRRESSTCSGSTNASR